MGHNESKPREDDVQYDVTIYTGTRRHAGTDSSVYVILHGDKGVSDELRLHHNTKEDFTRGHVDTHAVYSKDLGNLWKIEIWKDDKKDKPGHWMVEKVVVQQKAIPDSKKKEVRKELKRANSLTQSMIEESKTYLSPNSPRERSKSRGSKSDLRHEEVAKVMATWTFPCFRWIDEREEFWEGTTKLLQYETQLDRLDNRRDELERKRGLYQWKYHPGLPSFVRCKFATLPFDERWTIEKQEDFLGPRMKAGANFGLDKIFELFHTWKDFDDYLDLFTLLPVPKLQKVWRLDETFGKQRIQGVNPSTIQRVVSLPIPNFPVTDELVSGLLKAGATLQSEMAANRLYIVDYSFFAEYDKLECIKEGRGLASPICLLYVNEEGKLMPIAIQLRTSVPSDPKTNPIFTPKDSEPEWLLCKMYFAQADGMHHQISAHLLGTHLITEPMVIAMHRALPSCHPVYKLLNPHFKFQLAINTRARELMIAPGGPVDEVMPLKQEFIMEGIRKAYRQWRFDEASLPAMLKKREITSNPNDLPGYYYRDDGTIIWDAILSYVHELMGVYYQTNDDIRHDIELQHFLSEIADIGYRGEDKGLPKKVETLDNLAWILATIIWTVSAQHGVLNFAQYENYGFIPASPGALYIYPFGHPKSTWVRGKLTMKDIFNALPPKTACAKQIAMTYVLSQYSSEDNMLGQYPETYFTEEKAALALENYNKKLAIITKTITDRGDWDRMLPNKIPNATAV